MSAHDYEFYETPQVFTRYLFDAVPITGVVLEPCAGSGAIVSAGADMRACAGGLSCLTNDLDPRWKADWHLDATKPELWAAASAKSLEVYGKEIDWTVSNPPFTPAIPIIAQAIEHSRVGVAMHLRASIHEPLKTESVLKDGRPRTSLRGQRAAMRRTFIASHPPTGILWLPRFAYQRSKTTGKWTTDSVCACWVIWLKDPQAPQFIRYAPEWVIDALEAETPVHRARMDGIMAERRAAVA